MAIFYPTTLGLKKPSFTKQNILEAVWLRNILIFSRREANAVLCLRYRRRRWLWQERSTFASHSTELNMKVLGYPKVFQDLSAAFKCLEDGSCACFSTSRPGFILSCRFIVAMNMKSPTRWLKSTQRFLLHLIRPEGNREKRWILGAGHAGAIESFSTQFRDWRPILMIPDERTTTGTGGLFQIFCLEWFGGNLEFWSLNSPIVTGNHDAIGSEYHLHGSLAVKKSEDIKVR